MLSHVLASVEVTYQNLDSIELGVTTVDHYFDTLGGISRAVRQARNGVQADGVEQICAEVFPDEPLNDRSHLAVDEAVATVMRPRG